MPKSAAMVPQHEGHGPVEILALACEDSTCDFKPRKMHRRALLDHDVQFDIKYCGVCHSDLSTAAGHTAGIQEVKWPVVPGHELVGVVTAVGPKVSRVKVGQHVGVGCLVDSCRRCSACRNGQEQDCSKMVGTYVGRDNGSGRAQTYPPNQMTLGGYSTVMVADEEVCVEIPPEYPLEFAGPLLCAAVTIYAPLKRFGLERLRHGQGAAVGIVGLGGLGQMGIKIAKALGARVTVISRTSAKAALAKSLGADAFVASSDKGEMAAHAKELDLIINTVPAYHNYVAYHPLLAKRGYQILLGLHKGLAAALVVDKLTLGKSRIKHSLIGGIADTQEIVNLCAKHRIFPEIKVVPVTEISAVYAKLDSNNDEGIRYVLDIANTLNEKAIGAFAVKAAPPPTIKPAHGTLEIPAVAREVCWLVATGKFL
jgi:uncharacterized zinc-type alcohol dehydrogenase-like protein